MTIERVKMIKTVQSGRDCWEAGEIYPEGDEPLHPVLLQEIVLRTGTVEVLSHKDEAKKDNLKQPLSDNSLAEAQHKEKEALEKASLEQERADQILIEKRKLAETIEEFQIRLEALTGLVTDLKISVTLVGKRLDALEEKETPDAGAQVDELSKRIVFNENNIKLLFNSGKDAPSVKTRGTKAPVKRKVIVRRNR